MEHRSHKFYDIRFGILIAIIVSMLLFKYFTSPAAKPSVYSPSASSSAAPSHSGDTARAAAR